MGTASTGIIRALILNGKVESLVMFSQVGSYLPRALDSPKVQLRSCWVRDRPLSLLLTLRIMLKRSRGLDGFLFNVYLTAFGRTSLANGVGLLMPPLLALLTRKPVIVYMHNLLETQDVAQLGYQPTFLQRLGARFLERLLLRWTTVVVPLKSQREKVVEAFGIVVQRAPLPFIEPFGLLAALGKAPKNDAISSDEPTRILLLGNWGPQKDLMGVLHALRVAHERGGRFTVSITGAVNPQFPQYQREVGRAVDSMDPKWFRFLGYVPEAELLDVVLSHDLLILPYNATGGYSGAMSVGTYCGAGVIAYDLPQLRETAVELGVRPSFVMKNDVDAIVNEILYFSGNVRHFREFRAHVPRPEYDSRACESTNRLLEFMSSPDES
ncbi:MAG TPA: hypothetical protein VJ021_00965 [Thermoplasmata archaeon]|nr:hypothetical protein [Thermoplasmata archaeon]